MCDIELRCRCGAVSGLARNVSPDSGTRLVCCCKDCQAFARHLGQEENILDVYGGTDIYQLTPAQIEVTSGADNIQCLRLMSNGLYRWYANCCNTPIGNTMGSGMPFVGLIHSFISDEGNHDAKLGPVLGSVHTKSSRTPVPTNRKCHRSQMSLIFRVLTKLILWKIKGGARPNLFFKEDGKPISEPTVINKSSSSQTQDGQ